MRTRTIHNDYFFRGRGVSLTGCNLNATTTVQLCTEIFFVEESGSLTESQHTVSLTGSHSLPATATAAQPPGERRRYRGDSRASSKRGCRDNHCGNYVVIVFAKLI